MIGADILVIQRLLTDYDAGRSIKLPETLKHELLLVLVAVSEMNGNHQSNLFASHDSCPTSHSTENMQNSTLIIDGQALVFAIGKPTDLVLFWEHLFKMY